MTWLPRGYEFLSGLPERKRKRRLILPIQAFMDESGVKGTDPVFVFAGFIGRAERWAEFSDEWQRWLDCSPAINYLKMNEAVNLDGEFRHWKATDRDKKLAGCIDILKKYPQKAIYVTVDIPAYQMSVGKQKHHVSDPYFTAFFAIVAGVGHEVIDTGVPEPLDLIFDEHAIFSPRINLWYPVMLEMVRELDDPALARVLPLFPMFRDDKEFLPLQPSDVIAWLFRMSWSGYRTEFEWIASELAPVIEMSRYSTIYDGERLGELEARISEAQKHMTPERIARWNKKLGITPKRGRKAAARLNEKRR